ncbi:hypothetical protein MAR_026779, partial [Mya arenaria]
MQAFEHLRNIDGMWNNWTTDFYSYEPQPQCPDCGNLTYLYCDKCIDSIRFSSGVCVSKQISDCKERGRRSAPNLTPLHHKACHGKFVIVGMQGDGRDRHNTDAENRKILSAFIALAVLFVNSTLCLVSDGETLSKWYTMPCVGWGNI